MERFDGKCLSEGYSLGKILYINKETALQTESFSCAVPSAFAFPPREDQLKTRFLTAGSARLS